MNNLRLTSNGDVTAQEMKFSIKDFFSNCDQICGKLWIRSHLLKKSLMENFIFCAVCVARFGTICTILKTWKNTRSVTFSKVAGYKVTLLHRCFSHFLNCTNGTKSHKTSHMETCSSVFRTLKVPFLKVLLPKTFRNFDNFLLFLY